MADDADAGLSAQEWALEQVLDDGPALIVADRHRAGGAADPRPHDLDEPDRQSETDAARPDVNAGAKWAAVWLGSGVLGVAALIVAAMVVFGGGPHRAPAAVGHRAPAPALAAAPTATSPAAPQHDQAVPFLARTDSCAPSGGSGPGPAARSAQALTDTATDSAWVCGRGPQESFLDGQVLHVVFTADPPRADAPCSYMLDAVSVTPGWVAKTPGGADEWRQHRVVTRLQFNFFTGDQLAGDPFFLDTHAVHGPVSAALPTRMLASRVDVVILHTDRPPAAPLPTSSEPTAAPPADPDAGDPVDATFAMSQLQFFGHPPH